MSSNHLVLPIVNTVLSTKVSLLPKQMNNDIYYNLKYNIEKKVQGKCSEFGFVIKVLKIEDYNEGVVDGENFTGSAVYNIRYLASLCIPVEKTQIICKIENINNAIILATHGPISCVITPDNINTLLFVNEIGKYYYIQDKQRTELKKGDLIKCTILSKKLYKNDIMISLGFLDEIANQNEKDNFYKPELFNPDEQVEETVELVEFHEDEQVDEQPNAPVNEVNTNKKSTNEFVI
jgi:DNA-directed RNA polymerase subunit E'/Rpb7